MELWTTEARTGTSRYVQVNGTSFLISKSSQSFVTLFLRNTSVRRCLRETSSSGNLNQICVSTRSYSGPKIR